MGEKDISFAELSCAGLLGIGAGRPRSAGLDRFPLPILRVADVVEGRVLPSSEVIVPDTDSRDFGPKISKPGDVVLTTKGTVGRVAIMPSGGPTYAYSPQLCYFRPTAEGPLRARYLYYWFQSTEFWKQADALKGQTDMADFISLSDLGSIRITLPSVDEQLSAIGILGALDDKIAANGRILESAEALSRSIWIEATALGRLIPLSLLANFVNGRAFTKGATGKGRVVVRIAELNSGIGPSTVYNDIEVPDENLARPGDLLFSWSGSLTVARWFRPEAIVNQHIFKVIPKAGYPMWLVHQAVRSKLSDFKSIASDKATTMGHIQRRHLDEDVRIPLPDSIGCLDAEMASLWSAALAAEIENLHLMLTRDSLLPLLMSGNVTVKTAEKIVGDVT